MAGKRALFEAWRGHYNDSPRVLSEHLKLAAPGFRQTWVGHDSSRFPQGTRLTARHRPGHFLSLATCNLLITNDIVTRHFAKGRSVFYLQTWHGSPIKVIGLDEKNPKYGNGRAHLKRMLRDSSKWDLLLSSSPAYSDIYRRAFAYDGEILEVGYPRNDILVNDDGTRRKAVRDMLGITPEQLAVLYAPTWRDDAPRPGGGFVQPSLVAWEELYELMPETTVFLNRLHQHVTAYPSLGDADRILDVSDHEEISDLILASDVLVSDYSSLIYDYAVSQRPIILHAPDLDHYRDDVRDFYFDYEEWAPGPITSSTEELAYTLLHLERFVEEHKTRYENFRQTYCTFENGQASTRTLAALQARGVC